MEQQEGIQSCRIGQFKMKWLSSQIFFSTSENSPHICLAGSFDLSAALKTGRGIAPSFVPVGLCPHFFPAPLRSVADCVSQSRPPLACASSGP